MSTISGGSPRWRTLLLAAFGVGTLAAVQPACSREPGGATAGGESATPSEELTGKVGLQLTLPSGVQLNSIQWAITGPNGTSTAVQAGTADVQNSEAIRFLVGDIPTGMGFDISLSGTSTDGSVTCTGSASFDIVARMTTKVSVALACTTDEPDSGLAFVSASAYDCASVISVTANPAETTVVASVAVSGSATGPNASGLTYSWSASSGSFDTPTAPQANFTCDVAGPATLTLTARDGPVLDGGPCNPELGMMAIQVQCDPISDAGATSDAGDPSSPDATPDAGATQDASAGSSAGEAGGGTLTAAGDTFSAQQGVALTVPLATFTATDLADTASEFEVMITWGDGTTAPGTVTGGSGAFGVSGTHTYVTAGSFTVTVSIADTLGTATAPATSSADVSSGED